MIKNPVIGIIGGNGSMGKMFVHFFQKNGYEVLVASRSTELSVEECAKKSDVLLLSVPMEITGHIIEKVAPLMRKEALLTDLTSLKVKPMEKMLELSQCSVLGTHPVFGPGLTSFRNQSVVLCPGRGEEWFEWMKNLFLHEEARVKVCTAEKHDQMMAVIQCLIHFNTITLGHTLKELGFDLTEGTDFSSPIYQLRLDMIGRILGQDPSLYADIAIMNPESMKVLSTYMESSKQLYQTVEQQDIKGFINYFNEASDYLGDYKEKAMEHSNAMIQFLVKIMDQEKKH